MMYKFKPDMRFRLDDLIERYKTTEFYFLQLATIDTNMHTPEKLKGYIEAYGMAREILMNLKFIRNRIDPDYKLRKQRQHAQSQITHLNNIIRHNPRAILPELKAMTEEELKARKNELSANLKFSPSGHFTEDEIKTLQTCFSEKTKDEDPALFNFSANGFEVCKPKSSLQITHSYDRRVIDTRSPSPCSSSDFPRSSSDAAITQTIESAFDKLHITASSKADLGLPKNGEEETIAIPSSSRTTLSPR